MLAKANKPFLSGKVLVRHALDVVGHSLLKANQHRQQPMSVASQATRLPDYSTKTTDAYHQQNIFIGKNVQLAGYLNAGAGGKITIEDNIAIGHYTSIIAEQYEGIRETQGDVRSLPKKYREITIGTGAWIGNNCVIMANVGKGSVIGAGTVVTKDIPEYSIAVGNPARVIAQRQSS